MRETQHLNTMGIFTIRYLQTERETLLVKGNGAKHLQLQLIYKKRHSPNIYNTKYLPLYYYLTTLFRSIRCYTVYAIGKFAYIIYNGLFQVHKQCIFGVYKVKVNNFVRDMNSQYWNKRCVL